LECGISPEIGERFDETVYLIVPTGLSDGKIVYGQYTGDCSAGGQDDSVHCSGSSEPTFFEKEAHRNGSGRPKQASRISESGKNGILELGCSGHQSGQVS